MPCILTDSGLLSHHTGMDKYQISPLDPLRFPLVNRFYKTYYPAGKPKKDEVIWTAQGKSGLCAAVRFKRFGENQLLTGMLVHPDLRGSGLSHELLQAVRNQVIEKPCYCLAYRHLVSLYQQHGFEVIDAANLPGDVEDRFHSYCNSGKDLVSMAYTDNVT